MPDQLAHLSLKNITKHYGDMAAANDISLDIPGGSFFSLLGPSGSGKTTLLMIIAGFVQPSAGRMELGGRDLTMLPAEKRNFGMVFQGYALFPNMTVGENVAFPLAVRKVNKTDQVKRVKAALDMVQLSNLIDRLPSQLSGGQQQRVALARALVFEPEILLLDEPLSALDKKLRVSLQSELRELQRRVGKTFICVTHDQEEALTMSDGIAIVREGKIAQCGTPRELFDRPASHFVADFLGESNFLEGHGVGVQANGDLHYRVGERAFVHAGELPAPGPVLVALRPYKTLLTAHEPVDMPNRISGQIKGWSYRGTEFHCEVVTPVGQIDVCSPTWKNEFTPLHGITVWLSWAPDAAVMVRDDRVKARVG
ncbi:ABC transporter ATP-binding protein [Polaromonas sp. P2-4]|nr:ABC transporter ATP-binding protein [Polaromonas sp. P2-4]